jgi:hypothetical protein
LTSTARHALRDVPNRHVEQLVDNVREMSQALKGLHIGQRVDVERLDSPQPNTETQLPG